MSLSQEPTQEQTIEQLEPKTLAEGVAPEEAGSTETPKLESDEDESETEG